MCRLDPDRDNDGVLNSVDACPDDSSVTLQRKVNADLTTDTDISHTLCGGTSGDSYVINLENTKAYRIEVSGPPYPAIEVLDSSGDAILGLLSCSQAFGRLDFHVRCRASVRNRQVTMALPAIDGQHTVRVTPASARATTYTLRVVVDPQRVPMGQVFTTLDTDKIQIGTSYYDNYAWWFFMETPDTVYATLRGYGTGNFITVEILRWPGRTFRRTEAIGTKSGDLINSGSAEHVIMLVLWDGSITNTGGTPAGWQLLFED